MRVRQLKAMWLVGRTFTPARVGATLGARAAARSNMVRGGE